MTTQMVARFLLPALVLPVVAASFPAPAAAVTTLTFGSEIGQAGRFAFTGLGTTAGTEDLVAQLTLTLTARTASSFTFSYNISNMAGGDIDAARLMSFGFDVDSPFYLGAVSSGDFNRVSSGIVSGVGYVNACFLMSGNSCTSNGGSGLQMGSDAGTGSFTLFLGLPMQTVTLRDSYVRWRQVKSQELDLNNASGLGLGQVVEMPLPEPRTWAMMIIGFGLVGLAARRKGGLPAAA